MSTSLNRRALVAGAATLPAIAIPATAQCVLAGADPVFAAIEAYRRTDAIDASIGTVRCLGQARPPSPLSLLVAAITDHIRHCHPAPGGSVSLAPRVAWPAPAAGPNPRGTGYRLGRSRP
jgi:hypothetical protein